MGTRTKPVPWNDVPMVVETNAPDTHARESLKHPVGHRTSRAIERDHTWIFTDGSGSGWHAAVVLRPDRPLRLVARSLPREMSNVGAEMNRLLLGLSALDPGERVTVVSDYLWDAYYILGWWNASKPALIRLVDQARALLTSRRPGFIRYIHTPRSSTRRHRLWRLERCGRQALRRAGRVRWRAVRGAGAGAPQGAATDLATPDLTVRVAPTA
jgi:hypothetical protein